MDINGKCRKAINEIVTVKCDRAWIAKERRNSEEYLPVQTLKMSHKNLCIMILRL